MSLFFFTLLTVANASDAGGRCELMNDLFVFHSVSEKDEGDCFIRLKRGDFTSE